MKAFSLVLRIFSGVLVMLVALIFAVIEAILIATLDFALFENEIIAIFQLILKLSLGILVFATGLTSIIKNHRVFLLEGIALLLSAVAISPFLSNNFGLYFVLLSAFFLLTHAVAFVILKPKRSDE